MKSLFEINNDELRVVSLDGHRISIRKIKLKNSYAPQKVIIPGKTLNEIPYKDTDAYTKQVLKVRDRYCDLYDMEDDKNVNN